MVLEDRDPAEPQAAGGALGLQGAGAGGSGCLQTVPNGDPERETPRPLELNQQGGVRRGAQISQLHLQSISLATLSGLCVHPRALYPGQIRFSSPSKCAHE